MNAVTSVNDDLVEDVALLARAYTDVENFVVLLAHEVRTRLKVTERALAREDETGLRIASENTRALEELVEDLLELARARPDSYADAADVMRWVIADLGDGADAQIVLGELGAVALPPALLRTVLRNLVANALEAGASRVDVFARGDGAICVRDNGPGVKPAMAAKIFGVYTSKFGGSGFALGLCREILRRRGGELWVELPSSFCFRL
jgi:signal transduction histidine kinase